MALFFSFILPPLKFFFHDNSTNQICMFSKIKLSPLFCLVILLVFSVEVANATSGNAIVDGDWDDAPTWLFGAINRKPTCADTATVPVGRTVTVNTQENLFPCGTPNIIYVYGILQFTNGNKLDLPCGSLVIIMPGGLIKKSTSGGGNSTLISICGVVEWKAGDGPITGPDTLGLHSTLPVRWLSFDATLDGKQVDINWVTGTEINNDYFVVTRSADANYFENVGYVDGSGNSTQQLRYSFTDYNPLPGVSYYRLLQIDFDGHTSKSQIVAVNRKAAGTESLIITPGSGLNSAAALYTSGIDGKSAFVITTVTGSLVYNETVTYKEGLNYISLPSLKSFAEGIYFARIVGDDGTGCQTKFMVTK
jgi:hypothetical protein